MRRLILLVFMASAIFAQAQRVDYDKIIFPVEIGSIPFEEKLVRLAWLNYPQNTILEIERSIAEKELTLTKWEWLDDVGASYNYNNANRGTNEDVVNSFYPRYNIGISVRFSRFVETPVKTKIAKDRVNIAEQDINMQKLFIRRYVLSLYNDYNMKIDVLKLLTDMAEDSYTTHVSIAQKFKDGEVTLERFNNSASSLSRAKEAKITAEYELRIAKLALEEYIGMKLEEIRE